MAMSVHLGVGGGDPRQNLLLAKLAEGFAGRTAEEAARRNKVEEENEEAVRNLSYRILLRQAQSKRTTLLGSMITILAHRDNRNNTLTIRRMLNPYSDTYYVTLDAEDALHNMTIRGGTMYLPTTPCAFQGKEAIEYHYALVHEVDCDNFIIVYMGHAYKVPRATMKAMTIADAKRNNLERKGIILVQNILKYYI